jgi:aspartyl-tRNA(Asn)/glutamyl-tRNA(Gln) amidotransferase subunit B
LDLATSNNLIQQKNTGALGEWADEVIAQNAQKVAEFKKGKKGLMGFFVGEVMKKSKGSADPKMVNEILTEKLN